MKPALDDIWDWLDQVPDPEIPVISVVDLGIGCVDETEQRPLAQVLRVKRVAVWIVLRQGQSSRAQRVWDRERLPWLVEGRDQVDIESVGVDLDQTQRPSFLPCH